MSVCACSLAGTAACKYCAINPNAELPPTVCTFTTSTANAPKDYPFFKMREERPQTNADRIRAMTDEELAQWLDDISKACYYEGYTKETDEPQMSPYPTSPAKWVTWLKQEADNGKD